MPFLHLLSYRSKITLAFSLLAFLGVFLVSSLFLYTGYQELRSSRLGSPLHPRRCMNTACNPLRCKTLRVLPA